MVLMDITMPQMEGIEAAERIVRQHPDARIVMVSSVGYQENVVAALQKGARHFVQKPVKPEVLYEVIQYVMGDEVVAPAASATAAGDTRMKMELIQPFINAADAVFAETVAVSTKIADVNDGRGRLSPQRRRSDHHHHGRYRRPHDFRHRTYRRHQDSLRPCRDPGGRVAEIVGETIFELANLVIGNAVTTLNDLASALRSPAAAAHRGRRHQDQRRYRSVCSML